MEKGINFAIASGLAILGGLGAQNFFYTVDAGERAIIFDKGFGGLKQDIKGEGMHFIIPFMQNAIKYEIRLRPKSINSLTGTKDLQTVDIGLRILHKPVPEMLPWIEKNLGHNYDDKILPSIGNEVLKSVVAQYDADQLLKQREEISKRIKNELTKRAQDFNIVLDDVAIVGLNFMKEYAQAIEFKQVAQQQAEMKKYVVQRDEEEKNAKVIRSEGESEAATMINNAVKTYGVAQLELQRLEASVEIANLLSKNPNVKYIPSGEGSNTLLNIGSGK